MPGCVAKRNKKFEKSLEKAADDAADDAHTGLLFLFFFRHGYQLLSFNIIKPKSTVPASTDIDT